MSNVNFVALPVVASVEAPNLVCEACYTESTPFTGAPCKGCEEARFGLLLAINGVRTGSFVFEVSIRYDKQLDGKPRIAGTDYKALPGDKAGKVHVGTLTAAPNNKKTGKIYLHVSDDQGRAKGVDLKALAAGNVESRPAFTNMILAGVKTFAILAAKPGPAAK